MPILVKRLCLIDTCRDAGCCNLLHLKHASEVSASALAAAVPSIANFWMSQRPFLPLKELVLVLPLLHGMHQKLLRLIPFFPVYKNSHIASKANEMSLGMFSRFFVELVLLTYDFRRCRYSQLRLANR